jgi:DNA-binding NtrC family response regulator
VRGSSALAAAVAAFEADFLLVSLKFYNWNRKRTALALGISYRGLMYKISRYNLTPKDKS